MARIILRVKKDTKMKVKTMLLASCSPPFAFRFPLSAFRCFFLAFCFLLCAFSSKAQTWEMGAFGGSAGYLGDLNQHNPVQPSGAAVGAFIQRNFNPYLSLKLDLTHGTISGADSTSNLQQFRNRNLSFKTRLNELTVLLEFNFMKFTPGADFNHYTPYLYFGAGVVDYNPTAVYQNVEYNLRPLMTEGAAYANTSIAIPYGAGFKYNFNSSWNVGFSFGYRYTRTDYLDDVSGAYVDRNTFTNPIAKALSDRSGEKTGTYLGIPGTQRGDYRGYDNYMFFGFSISFTFVSADCYYK